MVATIKVARTLTVRIDWHSFWTHCICLFAITMAYQNNVTVGAVDSTTSSRLGTRFRRKATTREQHHYNYDSISTTKVLLEDFSNPQHDWVEMNDPVMGGKSTGSFRIDNGVGIFEGQVVDVPFLHAPGFIQVRSMVDSDKPYPDISHCTAIELMLQSDVPDYQGYRMSFGTQHAPHGKMFAYGYKAHFTIQSTSIYNLNDHQSQYQSIVLPLMNFTDYWDDATGDAIKECDPNDTHYDHIYCPNQQALHNIQTIGIWGEGAEGSVSIKIQSIHAINCMNYNGNRSEENDSSLYEDSVDHSGVWSWVYNRLFRQQPQHQYSNDITGTTPTMWNPTIYRYRW